MWVLMEEEEEEEEEEEQCQHEQSKPELLTNLHAVLTVETCFLHMTSQILNDKFNYILYLQKIVDKIAPAFDVWPSPGLTDQEQESTIPSPHSPAPPMTQQAVDAHTCHPVMNTSIVKVSGFSSCIEDIIDMLYNVLIMLLLQAELLAVSLWMPQTKL
ncbi:hypothetical protein C8R44DRAFT_753522 [Mycena epipterygia]|nr:hypothetical protein C8R44DRAFT_753522 [Mycena epipterygia]